MEFHEKLQELRKNRGLTQEELAADLYVSRTAISKWESGRGYPSIDSLKEISRYFSVTIDDLLSGEKLLSLAEQEHRSNIRSLCDLLMGITDILSFTLIVLPLYPNAVDGYIYSVNLLAYESAVYPWIYWMLFSALIVVGIIKLLFAKCRIEKGHKLLTGLSMGLSIAAVLLLAVFREAYATAVTFGLLIVKVAVLMKSVMK